MSQTQAGKQDPLSFTKMAGAGNDFVVIDNRTGRVADAADLTRRVCTRGLSVGADGLILIENSSHATLGMRYYNSDGSLGEFCGNGARCAARFAFLNQIAPPAMTIETDAGIVSAEVADDLVTISLPPPQSYRAERSLRVGLATVQGSSIVVGVPHYVIFLRDDLWSQDIVPLGRAIRRHRELQPAGANVNFVVVRDGHSIEIRTYERGVEAETLACGSGIVASVSVSALFGRVSSPVKVLTRSGITLEVSFALDGSVVRDVRLKGDARAVFQGTLSSEAVEGFDPEVVRDPSPKVLSAE
ncbi:MAG: diaminopimelate epimerase [Thermoanaerobaculia bacterium]